MNFKPNQVIDIFFPSYISSLYRLFFFLRNIIRAVINVRQALSYTDDSLFSLLGYKYDRELISSERLIIRKVSAGIKNGRYYV